MTDEHDKALAPTETAEAQWARAEDRVQMAHPHDQQVTACLDWEKGAEAEFGFDFSALHQHAHWLSGRFVSALEGDESDADLATILFGVVSVALEIGVAVGQDTGRHIDIDTIGAVARRTFNSQEDTTALAETYEISPGAAEMIGLAYAMGRADG